MTRLLLTTCFFSLFAGSALAHIDAVAGISRVELTIADHFSKKPASIVIEYPPLGRNRDDVISITVNWRGSTVVIPKEELVGLPKIQIDAMKLRFGAYQDGTKYHYVDTFFGEPEEDSEHGFKQVWLLIQGDKFVERKTFITVQTGPKSYHFKQLTHKLQGEAETVINKHSESGPGE